MARQKGLAQPVIQILVGVIVALLMAPAAVKNRKPTSDSTKIVIMQALAIGHVLHHDNQVTGRL